jgi:three-Cys-motif partner protein
MSKVDLADYAGKEQAYVKHRLLAEYLPPLAYKVGSTWNSIVYIDAFSGPWQTNRRDLGDSSFAVAIKTLKEAQQGLLEKGKSRRIDCILVEESKTAFAELEAFATEQNTPTFGVHPLCGAFVDKIPDIKGLIRQNAPRAFKFIFLDPKGWSDIPMAAMKSFLKDRSCEVLINLMTRHIIRFLDEPDREQSYNDLFGRSEVLEKLRETPRDERADQAVREYCRSLKLLCGFKFVSSAVILEPDEESVRYYLVYATNDYHGIEVFKKAEGTAARIQDDVRLGARHQGGEQVELFLEGGSKESRVVAQLRAKYQARARRKIIEMLTNSVGTGGVAFVELYCEAMAFPLVIPSDLWRWICELKPAVEVKLAGSLKRKKASPAEDDRVLIVDRAALRDALINSKPS